MAKRYQRTIYWRKIVILIMILSMIVCTTILLVSIFRRSEGNLAISSRQFHFVIVGEYETLQAANSSANEIKQAGGAGYTMVDGDTFSVVVAVFNNSLDANSVSQNLRQNEGLLARVRVIEAPQLRFFSHDENLVRRLANLFNYPLELFTTLSRHSIDIDSGNITESHAVILLEQMRTNLSNKIMHEFSGFCDNLRIYSLRLTEFYLHFSTLIQQAINLHFSNCLPSNLRYITVSSILNYISMMRQLS